MSRIKARFKGWDNFKTPGLFKLDSYDVYNEPEKVSHSGLVLNKHIPIAMPGPF